MGLLKSLKKKLTAVQFLEIHSDEDSLPMNFLSDYTQEGYLVSKVLEQDRIPETVRGGRGMLHATSLLDMCPRYYHLKILIDKKRYSTPRSDDRIVWAIGRAVEKHIREQYINSVSAQGVIGDWGCLCGKTRYKGAIADITTYKCYKCDHTIKHYGELTLMDEDASLAGNPDLLYTRPDNKKVRVVEIKSMNKKRYDALKSPVANHVWQALIYRRLLAKNGYSPDDYVSIVYGCKDYSFKGLPYREFTIKCDESHEKVLDTMWEQAVKLKLFTEKVESGDSPELPERHKLCDSMFASKASHCDECTACFGVSK